MKKYFFGIALLLTTVLTHAQVKYFEGEWTVPEKTDLFSCICKLEINNTDVTATFAWTYIAIDSTDKELTEMYRNKKGMTGIEFSAGKYNSVSGDIYLVASGLDDPMKYLA